MVDFSPEYKQRITPDFIDDFWAAYTTPELAQKWFGGNFHQAKRLIERLRESGQLPRGYRPQKGEDTRQAREAFDGGAGTQTLPSPVNIARATEESKDAALAYNVHRDTANLHRKMMREADRFALLAQLIEEKLTPVPPVPIPSATYAPNREANVLTLLVGDVHAGQLVTEADSGGLERYDAEVFRARGTRLTRQLIERTNELRQSRTVDVCELVLLGDNTEGENIFPAQGMYADMPTIDQIRVAQEFFYELIAAAAANFRTVRIRAVRGNHGRPGQKGANHARTNWDDVLYILLRSMFRDQKNVEFYISASSEMLYEIPEIPGRHYLIVHGEHAKRNGLRQYRDEAAGNFNLPINGVFIGHFHSPKVEDLPHGVGVINGTFVGGNTYSKDCFRATNAPKQILCVLRPSVGIEQYHQLYLDDVSQPQLKKTECGVYTPLVS